MKKIFIWILSLALILSSCREEPELITLRDKNSEAVEIEAGDPTEQIEENEKPEKPGAEEAPEEPEESERPAGPAENEPQEGGVAEGGEAEEGDNDDEVGGEIENTESGITEGQEGETDGEAGDNPGEHPKDEDEEVIQEEPEPIPEVEEIRKQLTLMIYMAADNDLESYAIQNLKMMESSKVDEVNILVLLDRSEGYDETNGNWTDTRLFEVCKDTSGGAFIVSKRIDCPDLGLSKDVNTELDMANPFVLQKFVEFGRRAYEAEKYALIIWGHGTGWRYVSKNSLSGIKSAEKTADRVSEGFSSKGTDSIRAVAIDDKTGSYMRVSELGQAVRGQGLDVIGFDACFGGVFENVYELKDCAEYTVACPGVTPAGGWNYKYLLESFAAGADCETGSADCETASGGCEPDSTGYEPTGTDYEPASTEYELTSTDYEPAATPPSLTTRELAFLMANSSPVETTVFENSELSNLMSSFEDFSRLLAASIKSAVQRNSVFDSLLTIKSYSYIQYPCDLYLDIFSLADLYSEASSYELAQSAKELKRAVSKSAFSKNNDTGGIGIHFIPMLSAHVTAAVHSNEYIKNPNALGQNSFVKESQWWVPTISGKSGSLLDKLFYTVYQE